MKNLFLVAAVTAVFDVASAAAAELPTFELTGLPITPHQGCARGRNKCSGAVAHPNAYASSRRRDGHQCLELREGETC